MPTLLVVDDEPYMLDFVARAMTHRGWTVVQAETVDVAVTVARQTPIDVALCDVVMPKRGGSELASALRSAPTEVPVILMSGHPMAQQPPSGMPCWGDPPQILAKPFRLRDLERAVEGALETP
jgi:two-component system OmpR family response regulator